jgi:hypothetical protein
MEAGKRALKTTKDPIAQYMWSAPYPNRNRGCSCPAAVAMRKLKCNEAEENGYWGTERPTETEITALRSSSSLMFPRHSYPYADRLKIVYTAK